MIKAENLTKVYSENSGNFNINLSISKGEVFGIIGPNGAGKTTLIRQILGFISPDKGNVRIDELDPFLNIDKIMKKTGYLPGEVSLNDDLKGIDYLKTVHFLRNGTNEDWEYTKKLINYFEIDTKTKIKKMSKGMKQKIAIITSVMHKPELLIMDEPTSGLDPVMQDLFNAFILKLKNENNTTIIICSHIFEEIAKTCDRVAIIKNGILVKEFNVSDKDIEKISKEFSDVYKRKEFK
ncbi:ABC transporter ATP-binding protein [Mesoplasma photuris]|uniref:ABC transporter ATP-binding protein n=1 Tax=Mesoplasma photuris TaxID=217731 RepID=UPI0004E1F95D|nr:ATP-binding cassette domain-containing protein [Mesoplasma photuris]